MPAKSQQERLDYYRDYRTKHREKINEYMKNYMKTYYQQNRDVLLAKANERYRNKKATLSQARQDLQSLEQFGSTSSNTQVQSQDSQPSEHFVEVTVSSPPNQG